MIGDISSAYVCVCCACAVVNRMLALLQRQQHTLSVIIVNFYHNSSSCSRVHKIILYTLIVHSSGWHHRRRISSFPRAVVDFWWRLMVCFYGTWFRISTSYLFFSMFSRYNPSAPKGRRSGEKLIATNLIRMKQYVVCERRTETIIEKGLRLSGAFKRGIDTAWKYNKLVTSIIR